MTLERFFESVLTLSSVVSERKPDNSFEALHGCLAVNDRSNREMVGVARNHRVGIIRLLNPNGPEGFAFIVHVYQNQNLQDRGWKEALQ